ncbi:Murein DD-endopeptidase MepM and murein hydrolase activator NlpD, contain LysM domain [Rhodoblastus acidophilus]|uniref:Murein DD-endopeptidase MepM and murein hydrolase activator NlpD, contain LysM domain n=1 Tax=Rhodoblastus acidophilus TaxID=1074 RepID=A0A212Q3E0_RHOAC|nr:M23 family metallopeptidase [Rhodoblastus acidophilus]PPQ37171.1 M23 family peptidase [Rhodoblastus acidophilus]RAI18120.1 M23 family peptidase [Rhodoblastus acidophilus]SNB53839.1 Murein DD-endopeptidase MepM and murein hydrolase activator NlpD, contain LysM domain [Rhodoblastus acidophilus]
MRHAPTAQNPAAQNPTAQDPHLLAISLAFRSFRRDLRLAPHWVYLLFGLVPMLVAALLGTGLYLVFRDDMLTALMRRQAQMQFAYEDRIAALRDQVDQMATRQLANQDTVEGKVAELAMRQARLESRSALVSALAAKIAPAPAASEGVSAINRATRVPLPAAASAYAPLKPAVAAPAQGKLTPEAVAPAKPAPEGFDLRRGAEGAPVPEDVSDAADFLSPQDRLQALAANVDRIEHKQVSALETLRAPAAARAENLRLAFAEAGLPVERMMRRANADKPADAVGGPFEPAGGAFERLFGEVNRSVALMEGLRRALPYAPLRQPLPGALDVTSVFGYRTDPFLGRPALHSGMDLRAPYGDAVRATASGRVSVAESSGGYGNLVEVDHGAGLATRYGHLSEIDVSEGQWVEAGAVIGRIGSTGRSTGPHLHYEVRVDGAAVDPTRYLKAGRLLTAGL